MVEVSYTSHLEREVTAYLRDVQRAAVEEATPAALTKIAKKTRTKWLGYMRADVQFAARGTKGSLKAGFKAYPAKVDRWISSVWGKTRPVRLGLFKALQTRKGVHVYPTRSGAPVFVPGGFIATMPSGRVGVFKRGPGSRRGAARQIKRGRNAGGWYRPALPIVEQNLVGGLRVLGESTKSKAIAFATSIAGAEFDAARHRALQRNGLAA